MFSAGALDEPDKKRAERWRALVGLPFSLFEAAQHMDSRAVQCPMCQTLVDVRA